ETAGPESGGGFKGDKRQRQDEGGNQDLAGRWGVAVAVRAVRMRVMVMSTHPAFIVARAERRVVSGLAWSDPGFFTLGWLVNDGRFNSRLPVSIPGAVARWIMCLFRMDTISRTRTGVIQRFVEKSGKPLLSSKG